MSREVKLQDKLIGFLRSKLDEQRKEVERLKLDNTRLANENTNLTMQILTYDLFLHELESDLIKMGGSKEAIDLLKSKARRTCG